MVIGQSARVIIFALLKADLDGRCAYVGGTSQVYVQNDSEQPEELLHGFDKVFLRVWHQIDPRLRLYDHFVSLAGNALTSRVPAHIVASGSSMSALPPKADIPNRWWNVSFVPKADYAVQQKQRDRVAAVSPNFD